MSKQKKKQPRPWYRPSRGVWYLTLDGKQINLGPDEELAHRRYFELMATRAKQPKRPVLPAGQVSLTEVVEEFLEYVSKERAPDTYDWYRRRLKELHKRFRTIAAEELRPIDVRKWADGYGIAKTTRHNYMRSIKICLKWATAEGLITTNPLAHLKIPKAEQREVYVSPDEFETLLSFVPDPALRELMLVSYQTGCRPQESLHVEASHVDISNQRWVFSKSESKMKQISRIVYLCDSSMEIVRRNLLRHPNGAILRNSKGKPWTISAVNCGFTRLQLRMGKAAMKRRGEVISDDAIRGFMPTLSQTKMRRKNLVTKTPAELRHEAKTKLTARRAIQLAPRYCLYALRHSWATNALTRGLDSLTVAVLMGHQDPSTLARVYQHLSHNPQHLLDQARKAAG